MKEIEHNIINGQKVVYWQKNPAEKEVVVLLHGMPGNHMGLIDMAENLGDTCHIIIPDLPACGQSEDLQGGYSLKNYSDWLADFLESLGIGQAIIIGHSFGSRVALVFAMEHSAKVTKLILITPVMEVEGFIARIAALYYNIANILPGYFQKIWLSNGFAKEVGNTILFRSSDKKIQKEIIKRDVKELKKINQKVIIDLFNEFYKTKLVIYPEKLSMPILVIASDTDRIVPLKSTEALIRQLGQSSVQVMIDSGHLVPLESPQATAKTIMAWLQH